MENQGQFQQHSLQPQGALPNATAVLVLGIIAIVGCFCYGIVGLTCGIIALVLAKKDLVRYAADPSLYTQGSLSNLKAGKVCAIIGVCLSAFYILYVIFILVTVGTAVLSNPQEFLKQYR